MKKSFNIVYTSYAISSSYTSFVKDATYSLYKGSLMYYDISFRPNYDNPANGFLRLIFTNIEVGSTPFCYSAQIAPFLTELGLLCTV